MIFMINLSERAYLLLESVLTGLGLNVADILVKKTEERLCTTCICNVVEDEFHFLCQCHKYASQRKTLYDSLEDSNILLSLDSSKTFFELMTNDNKTVMKAIGKYIKECSIT